METSVGEMELIGTVKVAGITYEAAYLVDGINRQWLFDGIRLLSINPLGNPAGNAGYYEFPDIDKKEEAELKMIFKCRQKVAQ